MELVQWPAGWPDGAGASANPGSTSPRRFPVFPRSASRKDAERLRKAVFRELVVEFEEAVARELRLPGRRSHTVDRPRLEEEPMARKAAGREHPASVALRELFSWKLFTCPDATSATDLLAAMADAGLRAGRLGEVVAVCTDAPTRAEERQLRTRMISAALGADAEWVHGRHGPRQGTRGAFTEGPTHRAWARRRARSPTVAVCATRRPRRCAPASTDRHRSKTRGARVPLRCSPSSWIPTTSSSC